MDLAATRAALPGLVRSAFGERVSIRPMRSGEMRAVADEGRVVLEDVPARVDVWPELEQVGGGRERPTVAMAQGEHATASIERTALAYEPRPGDHLVRPPAKGGGVYRISRCGEGGEGRLLIYLSEAAS